MAMKRCPVCGEEYSETYRNCPFCEEAMAMEEGRPVHRRGGKRSAPQRGPNILTPVLIVVILVLALLLGYLFFGSAIRERLAAGSSQAPQSSQGASSGAASSVDPGILQEPDVSVPAGSAGAEPEGGGAPDPEAVSKLPKTLTVNKADFTLSAGESYTVKVTGGGTGGYTWFSSDEGVASVDAEGKVTAISKGKVEITVTDGAGRGSCVVYVKGGTAPAGAATTAPPSGGDGKTPQLNNTDFTRPVSEGAYQLRISGVTTAVAWKSSNPAVATVSDSGLVTPVSSGTATITAAYDGATLSCIVRVP